MKDIKAQDFATNDLIEALKERGFIVWSKADEDAAAEWAREQKLSKLMTLADVQREIQARWGSSTYGEDFLARKDPQRNAHHAHLHITKALGKIASMLDDLDHGSETDNTVAMENALADVVICASRVASSWPTGALNLADAVLRRIIDKFPEGEGGVSNAELPGARRKLSPQELVDKIRELDDEDDSIVTKFLDQMGEVRSKRLLAAIKRNLADHANAKREAKEYEAESALRAAVDFLDRSRL